MKYQVVIRLNNVGPTKFLMASEGDFDLTQAFTRADEMLESHKDCFAEIVEVETNEVVATFH